MQVLVACEFSGVVRNAFVARGHDAMSCDLLPSETERPDGWDGHYQGDVLELLADSSYRFDLLIAHPPCTRLCNSGVRWLNERNLWTEMEQAALFFKALLDCNIPKRCIENPLPHSYAVEIIGASYNQVIHPWQFGHEESKTTCLWLRNLPQLKPTNIVSIAKQKIHTMSPGANRSKERSRTYQGIADAFASQWG